MGIQMYDVKDIYVNTTLQDDGIIRNTRGVPRRTRLSHNGYPIISLSLVDNGGKKTVKVHRLVAQQFIPNPNNYPHVNHIDGVKTNNSVDNLEWTTPKKNMEHAGKLGLRNFDWGYSKQTKEKCAELLRTLSVNEVHKLTGVHTCSLYNWRSNL